MKSKVLFLFVLVAITLFLSCSPGKNVYRLTKNYVPDDPKLYETIVALDSTFFAAYNTCDVHLEEYGSFYSDDIEFYHDNGGVMTSKQAIIDATKKYVCGKVTRELVKGSLEVYPIKDYGAVAIGLHIFHNREEPDAAPKASRFTVFWKKVNNEWKIAKVISLH